MLERGDGVEQLGHDPRGHGHLVLPQGEALALGHGHVAEHGDLDGGGLAGHDHAVGAELGPGQVEAEAHVPGVHEDHLDVLAQDGAGAAALGAREEVAFALRNREERPFLCDVPFVAL